MKNRILSLALCLALCLSFVLPAAQVSAAEGDNGMVINKTATANDDGSYTIMLEAYATGAKIITETSKDVPTDIVLVLDQSGSMSSSIKTVAFEAYEDGRNDYNTRNRDHYDNRHNGGNANLWYKLADGTYASVSVQIEADYVEYNNESNTTYYNADNLYVLIDGVYHKVSVSYSFGMGGTLYYTYTANGKTVATGTGRNNTPTFADGYNSFYKTDDSTAVYTYTYTDSNGVTQTIGTSTGADTQFGTTLYERVTSNSGTSKLEALISAVNIFVDNVSEKALGADGAVGGGDDVDHRIAIVGFASTRSGGSYGNTELLSTQNAVNYANATDANYKDAMVSVNNTNGTLNTRLSTAINRLSASGDTYLEYGMDMANKIFAQYPIAEDDKTGRQRVVVVFTDGYPAPSGTNDFNYDMADNAISNANTTKNSYDATVYTVAVLDDADPTASITDGYSYGGLSTSQQTVASNRYMHYVSSNYPNAQNMTNGGSLSSKANPFNGGDSYYLSATDSATLNNIFQQISDQIESGGTSATLTEEAVVKDIIAPEFTLPANATAADITLETWHCTGKNGDEYTWTQNGTAMGAEAVVKGNDVSVSGFDFADNYVGTVTQNGETTYRGDKLVIKFKVYPKDGYLGGNNVYTNASAGIYENKDATEPLLVFNRPQVNVPIDRVVVAEVTDQNVYLNETLTGAELIAGTKVTVGNVNLDFSKENYGLAAWQNDDVNITVTYTDKDGNKVTSFDKLKADNSYTVTVTVSPKEEPVATEGTPATAQSNSDSGLINVYMPTITFKDSAINAGTAPVYETENFAGVKWLHGTVEATANMGTAPGLTYKYTPDAAVLTAESEVQVSVKMGDEDVTPYVNFMRNACDDCGFEGGSVNAKDPNRVNFVVHINTFDLTITKSGVDVNKDGAAPFVFNVKGGDIDMDVVIYGNNSVTIKGLPAGTYTVKEVNGYWRYDIASDDTASKTVTPSGTTASVEFKNARTEDKWLDDWAKATNNFG